MKIKVSLEVLSKEPMLKEIVERFPNLQGRFENLPQCWVEFEMGTQIDHIPEPLRSLFAEQTRKTMLPMMAAIILIALTLDGDLIRTFKGPPGPEIKLAVEVVGKGLDAILEELNERARVLLLDHSF